MTNPTFSEGADDERVRSALAIMQLRKLCERTWLVQPVLGSLIVLLGVALLQHVPWWLAIVAPIAVSLRCAYVLFESQRMTSDLSDSGVLKFLRARSFGSVITSAVMAVWTVAVCLYGSLELAYFMTAVVSCTVFGLFTYVAYLAVPIRLILALSGATMLLVFGWLGDPLGLVFSVVFIATAYLLMHSLTGHFDEVQSLLGHEVVAQARILAAERTQAEVSRIANTDELTGIPNRRAFFNAVNELIAARQGSHETFALGVIDLDGFKPINDCYGHGAGDVVLIEVARRLQKHFGADGFVARLGGDEFAVVLPNGRDRDVVCGLGQEAILSLSEPIAINDVTAQVSASCGFALYPEAGVTAATLLECADEALYRVKNQTRSAAKVYDVQCRLKALREASLQQKLRRAIEADAIDLHYQPIVCVRTGRILYFEALARWRDVDGTDISPGEFIPLAERDGLISGLSPKLFAKATRAAVSWPSNVGLSFNLSGTRLTDPSLGTSLLAALNQAGLSPERLILELTETALPQDFERAAEMLAALRAIGVRIAMDDFGSGYSGLTYLDRMPIDCLKIDRSIIREAATNRNRREIVTAVIRLGKSLHLTCVAEGIEDAEQFAVVKNAGCDAVQGYLVGRPLPPEQLAVYLDRPSISQVP